MIVSILMIKFREQIGDSIGDAEWMHYVGGVYNFVIILAVIFFFWAVASLTGTTHIFFAPLYFLLGGAFHPSSAPPAAKFSRPTPSIRAPIPTVNSGPRCAAKDGILTCS